MHELEAKGKKKSKIEITYIVEVELLAILVAYLLPLADFFAFNFSFSTLPDIISNNIPVFFL